MDTKRNDWLATMINQPQFDFEDLQEHGITPDNTTIKSRDYYKSLPQIQQIFSDKNGKFQEELFNNYYLGALQAYNEYADSQFTNEMIKSYDPYDWTAPIGSKNKDTSVTISIGDNPERKSYGISNLKEIGKSNLSTREIAQTNKVWDPVSESFLDWSPNDKGGFIKALNRPTLALAIYEEDGTHEVNGRTFRHQKGELRLNEKGEPFYEILTPDKEIYGRDVLHYTDTFTVDGEKWNKYDFFDSDGIDKSIGGTIMKTAVGVAPMLIPGVGTVFGLASAGLALTQLLPVLGKSISNIFNNDKDTDFERVLTKIENWGAQFQSSVSDKSREKIATFENLGQLVKDVSLQLFQQQSIGKIPLLFGKTEKNLELGRNLALGYMAGTSAQNAYSAFKDAGASDAVAGWGMLASVFAMWKLMNIDYFKDSLFKGTFFDDSIVKTPIIEAAKETAEAAKFMSPGKAFTWIESHINQKVANATRKTVGKFKDWGDPNKVGNVFLMRAINEGTEETLEELSQDAVKALFTGLDYLGIPTTSEKDSDLNFGWNLGDAFSRYITSFVGGAIGGPIFELHNRWQKQLNNEITKTIDRSSFSQIAYLLAQNKRSEIDKYLDLFHKKGKLGNKNLSGIKYELKPGKDGKLEIVYEEAENGQSQNDVVYNALVSYVDNLERIMEEEGLILPLGDENLNILKGAIISPDSFKDILDAEFLERINTIGANSSKLNDLQNLTERIIKIRSELDAIAEKTTPKTDDKTAQQQAALKLPSNQQVQKLQRQLSDARTKLEQIKNGDLNGYYLNQAKFVLTKDISDLFAITDIEKYSLWKTKTSYSALPQEKQEELKEDFDLYMNNEAKYRIFKGYDVYLNASQAFAERILQENESLKNVKYNDFFSGNVQGSILVSLNEQAEVLQRRQNKLSEKLKSGENLSDEEQKELNDINSKIDDINKKVDFLHKLPSTVLLDETTDKFKFFDRESIQSLDPTALGIFGENLKKYYQYLSTNNIVSKGDKDLYFLMSQVIKPWSAVSLRQRAQEQFKNVYFDIDAELNERLDNGDDEDNYFNEKETVINGKAYNLVYDLARDTGDLNFFKEFEELINRFIIASQNNIQEAFDIYDRLIELFDKQPELKDKAEDFVKQVLPQINGQSIIDYFQEIKKLKENVKESSLLSLLDDFVVAINGEPMKVISIIKKEKQRLLEKHTLDDYVIEDETMEKQIAETQSYLNVLEALLNGAYSGLNESINNTSKIYNLAVIDENTKNILNAEISTLRNELNTLSLISSLNKFRRLSIHQKVEVNMRPKFITQLKDYATTFYKEFNVNIEPLYEKYFGTLDFKNANVENWADYEKSIIDFETELGQSLKAKYDNDHKNFISKLVNIFDKEIWKRKSSNLTDKTDEVSSSYDLLVNLAVITAINPTEFYVKYRDNIINNEKYNFAPILGQEIATKTAYAYFKNPELFNLLNEQLTEVYSDKDPYIKAKPNLKNIIALLGAAGSGKTTAEDSSIYEMLKDEDVDFMYVAPGAAQLRSLVKAVGQEDPNPNFQFTKIETTETVDGKTHTIKGFLDQLSKDGVKYTTTAKIKIGDEEFNTHHVKGITLVEPKLGLNTNKRKIVFIDEISFFTEPELQLISDWAEKNNAFIIATGDQTQNSVNVEGNPSGIEDVNIIKTPELGFSMRTNSEAAIDNFQALYSILKQVQDLYKENPEWTVSKLDEQVVPLLAKGINIKTYAPRTSGDVPIVGSLLVENDSDILSWVQDLDKSISDRDYLFITDKVNDWKNKLPESFQDKIYTPENVQGLEAKYVIIDVNWKARSGDSKYKALRDFYTLTQRAANGTIIKNNDIKETLNITQLEDKLYKNVVEITTEQRDEFKKWRKKALSLLTAPSSTTEEKPSTPEASPKPEPKKDDSTPPIITPPPAPTPTPKDGTTENLTTDDVETPPTSSEGKADEKTDDSTNDTSEDLKSKDDDELINPADDLLVPENFDIDDTEIRGRNYSNNKRNKEFIKDVFTNSRYASIDNDDYFNWMHKNLVGTQIENNDSLWNHFGFMNEANFLKFARQISGAILFNDRFNASFWLDRDNVKKTFEDNKEKVRKFDAFINYTLTTPEGKLNDKNYDLFIESIGDKRFVIIKWKLEGKEVSLPIALVDTNITGKLNNKHPFSLVRGVTKYKTGRTRRLNTIESEEAGRIQMSEPAILGASEKSSAASAVDSVRNFVFGEKAKSEIDGTEKYIRQPQNGKVFVQFTDNPNYDLNDFIENWRYDQSNGQIQYLYQNHDVCGLMGVHKAVDPETLIKSVIALYAVLIDSEAYSNALTISDSNNAKIDRDRILLRDKYLAAAGIKSVDEARSLIENNIPNFTIASGLKPFARFVDGAGKANWKEFFKYYSDYSRQVMNYNSLSRLFTTVLESYYNPEKYDTFDNEIKIAIRNNLFELLNSNPYDSNKDEKGKPTTRTRNRIGLRIEEQEFAIDRRKVGNNYIYTIYQKEAKNRLTRFGEVTIDSTNDMQYPLYASLKYIFDQKGLDFKTNFNPKNVKTFFNSIVVDLDKKGNELSNTARAYGKCVNEIIYKLFRKIEGLDKIVDVIKKSGFFKEGFFANDVAGATFFGLDSDQSAFRKVKEYENSKGSKINGAYLTDVEFDGSVFSVDLTSLDVNASNNKSNEIQMYEEGLNKIQAFLEENQTGYEIPIIYKSKDIRQSNRDQLTELIEDINDYLKNHTNDFKYIQLNTSWISANDDFVLGDLEAVYINSPENLINNLLRNIGVYPKSFNQDLIKTGKNWNIYTFSVTLQDDSQRSFIMKHNGTNWEVKDFKSYDKYFKMMQEFNHTTKDIFNTGIPLEGEEIIKKYIHSVQDDEAIDFDIVNEYESLIEKFKGDPIYTNLKNVVNDYLQERLKNHEC